MFHKPRPSFAQGSNLATRTAVVTSCLRWEGGEDSTRSWCD